jgi:outer membrane lipoprotein SlyB
MNTSKTVAAVLIALAGLVGCETSHTESTSPTWTGGQKHEETTVYQNPITGNTSVEHEKTVNNQ